MDQREALKLLVQLVQLAQKRGAYSLDEAYLAFSAVSSVIQDSKLDEVKNYVKNLEQQNNTASQPSTVPTPATPYVPLSTIPETPSE